MATKSIRAPNNHILIAAAATLLLLAAFGVWKALVSNPYSIPVLDRVFIGGGWDAILGTALLFVALRGSPFAGVTAVVVASFLIFTDAFVLASGVAFGSPHVSWRMGVNLVIAATILWPLLVPWSWSANKRVLVWMGLTFGALALLLGSLAVLVRL